MANEEHLARLKQGVEAWNRWRKAHPDIRPELDGAIFSRASRDRTYYTTTHITGEHLSGADLSKAYLSEADFTCADLSGADLTEADVSGAALSHADLFEARLIKACFPRANLSGANLTRADLTEANLTRADLTEAHLTGANLTGANLGMVDLTVSHLSGANLSRADLRGARLMMTNFEGANLTGCSVYGISAWDVNLVKAQQSDLVITQEDQPTITVDNLEVAQFIYLLLHNEKIREVIDTITSKAVLILGRFTPERKAVLDAIREALRRRNYLPILFDFEKPASRDFTETISTLAHMARFIIADITEAKSIPQELERIIPGLPSVPVQPLLHVSAREYGMFEHFKRYPWVLEMYQYESLEEIIAALPEKVIVPAEVKTKELVGPGR
jgi:uncharacterized protein YjbI with pentapeptide repeats